MSEIKKLEDVCGWLRETKGITKVTLEELISYIPEYDKQLEKQ